MDEEITQGPSPRVAITRDKECLLNNLSTKVATQQTVNHPPQACPDKYLLGQSRYFFLTVNIAAEICTF